MISVPLLNNMKGILTAEIEVSEMNKHLTGFIQQEIVKGIELAMKDLMEQMIANKTEDAKTTITTFMEHNFKGTHKCRSHIYLSVFSSFFYHRAKSAKLFFSFSETLLSKPTCSTEEPHKTLPSFLGMR
jgi:hypothetical protein